MSDKIHNVLILCTGNSARSILGEALINHLGGGRLRGFSAGSQPTGKVNPYALKTLEKHGINVAEYRSKSWDEFGVPDAPQMDFVFTVCDSAAGESCPLWPGKPLKAHWGLPDPAHVGRNDEEAMAAFEAAYQIVHRRVAAFAALDIDAMDRTTLQARLMEIGQL